MPKSGSILLYGHDLDLLETRRLVLEYAGFRAEVVTSLEDAEKIVTAQPANLFVLCHSLSPRECENALRLAHSRQSVMKSLVLVTSAPAYRLGKDDELLNSFDGPTALVATVKRLLQPANPERVSGRRLSLKEDRGRTAGQGLKG